MRWLVALFLIGSGPATAEVLVAARTVRAQAILTAADLKLVPGSHPGALTAIEEALGMETRVVLYAGRPVGANDIGPPAIVDRNQIVPLIYGAAGLVIATEARALGRGGVGDRLRVMNLGSRNVVTGTVCADGSVTVGASGCRGGSRP
jgi:flagella basal body P-ring formation protein FlgA